VAATKILNGPQAQELRNWLYLKVHPTKREAVLSSIVRVLKRHQEAASNSAILGMAMREWDDRMGV